MGEEINWKIILYPFAVVAIVLIPMFESVLQIELMTNNSIPIHWRIFIGASIGGLLGAIVQTLKRIWNIQEEDLNAELVAANNRIETLSLEHKLTEREIMINALLLNEQWNKQNLEIKTLKDLELKLKSEIEEKKE